MAHCEPPHQDLRCLQLQLFPSLVVKEIILYCSFANDFPQTSSPVYECTSTFDTIQALLQGLLDVDSLIVALRKKRI